MTRDCSSRLHPRLLRVCLGPCLVAACALLLVACGSATSSGGGTSPSPAPSTTMEPGGGGSYSAWNASAAEVAQTTAATKAFIKAIAAHDAAAAKKLMAPDAEFKLADVTSEVKSLRWSPSTTNDSASQYNTTPHLVFSGGATVLVTPTKSSTLSKGYHSVNVEFHRASTDEPYKIWYFSIK